ncbi:uncharacterized protein LOC114563754 isoform X1 [Perca flavescens]|uniref:uncharacterized protein LOC114563754 isoform X1 n=1 Tax=Perca flavescens TaxID=8167 RepID=UPI00106E9AC3|nr:cytokine receptor common subunit beta isoform X1 [Perca flavescens]XP_028446399.1 cytokine receptor common subunit beta isoform X1 [Perca flavescens]XP_028446408.1 cytokine receptor common subunit beta isoform X1 [Perca flavescens]
MERYKKTPVLFLLLALLCDCAAGNPLCFHNSVSDLTCYTDYNSTITCVWNSTYVSDQPDNVCTIQSKGRSKFHSSSCNLEPADVSRPMPKKCVLIYKREGNFVTNHQLSIHLSCSPAKQILSISFTPACHIKLDPPRQPDIISTTVSWSTRLTPKPHGRIDSYSSQLQWKQKDVSWSDPSVKIIDTQCEYNCTAELDPNQIIQAERYQARTRVKAIAEDTESMWSDWSPTTSWVSQIGRTKQPPPPSDPTGGVFCIVAAATVFAVFLVVIHIKTDKTTWVYIAKRIKGPPLPNPANSFLNDANFQNWLSPYFTSESFQSFLKPVDIVSVEVTSTVDAVAPCGPEAALLEKMRSESSHTSTSSNFTNPSYSQLCPPPPPPPPVSSLTAGNLAPCATDTPYGPVGSQGEGNNAEQDREVRGKEVEIRQLLSKGSNNSEPMPVISDYEKAEKLQVECFRLQRLDSGVCSGEEVSQESFEADSINLTDSHEDGPEGEEQMEGGNGKEVDLQKLFGGSVDILGKGSIQVCSGYEQVQKLPADSPELWSLDSDIGSGGEEQMSQEESLEDIGKSTESTSLLPSPSPSSVLSYSLPSFTPLPLNFSGPGLSPALQPLPSHLLERIALISIKRSVEPSGDGYMPVRQEQS